ncbi:hypothetical protein ATCC90586_004456 [Pythium insidiosum]|nr:hypothetical protein ATCC90586_004456 [Pythium insidiosum]
MTDESNAPGEAPPPAAPRQQHRRSRFRSIAFDNLWSTVAAAQDLTRRAQWWDALVVIAYLLRNSLLATAFAWLLGFLISLGNFFSGDRPADQPLAMFTSASMFWTSFVLGTCVALAQAATFVPLQCVAHASRPHHSQLWWFRRLFQRLWWQFLVMLAAVAGLCYAIGSAQVGLQSLKLHFYVGGVVSNAFTVCVVDAAREMYLHDTVVGRERGGPQKSSRSWRRALRSQVRGLAMLPLVYVAAGYVHVASQIHLKTAQDTWIFLVASVTIKLITQEGAKHYLLRLKKTRPVLVNSFVAVPTVLIDTQIRLLMYRMPSGSTSSTSSTRASMTSSILLAFVELAMRLSRLLLLKLTIHRRKRRQLSMVAPTAVEKDADMLDWTTRLVQYHAAELQAVRADGSAT